jgi:hypothetical protein
VIREASHKARGYGFKSRGGFAPSQWVLHNLFISIILARRRRSFRTFGQAQATCRRGPRRLQVELPSPTAVGPTAAGCHDARRLVIKSEKISNGRIILQNLYYKERTQLKTFLTQFGLILPLTPDPPVVCFWKWIKWKDYKVQKNRNLESVSAKNEFFLTHITLPTHVPSSGPPGHAPAPRAYVKKLIRSLLFFLSPTPSRVWIYPARRLPLLPVVILHQSPGGSPASPPSSCSSMARHFPHPPLCSSHSPRLPQDPRARRPATGILLSYPPDQYPRRATPPSSRPLSTRSPPFSLPVPISTYPHLPAPPPSCLPRPIQV